MLFARDIKGPLSSLLKQFDTAVAKNKDADMRSFAIFLCDDGEEMEAKLKALAEKEKISENVPLAIVEDIAGPPAYKINKDAEVTVLLYTKGKVISNFAFKTGELQEKDVKTIVAQLPKILPTEEELKQQREAAERTKKLIEEIKKKNEEEKKKAQEAKKDSK
jgi:hypothetical protein